MGDLRSEIEALADEWWAEARRDRERIEAETVATALVRLATRVGVLERASRDLRAALASAAPAVSDGEGATSVDPALRDAHAQASYDYAEACADYEAALASRKPERRGTAEVALRRAGQRLSAALSAVVAARQADPSQPLTFAHLLLDPTQQLDPEGAVMASVVAYQNATTATMSAGEGATSEARDDESPFGDVPSGVNIARYFWHETDRRNPGCDGIDLWRDGAEYCYLWVTSMIDHDLFHSYLLDVRTKCDGDETRDYLFLHVGAEDRFEVEWHQHPVRYRDATMEHVERGLEWFVARDIEAMERHDRPASPVVAPSATEAPQAPAEPLDVALLGHPFDEAPAEQGFSVLSWVEEIGRQEAAERLFFVDKETGEPCPTMSNRLCTITDPDHRHKDGRPAPSPRPDTADDEGVE